jgi:NAD(P)H-hydrate epimerase
MKARFEMQMRIVSVKQMVALETEANQLGLPYHLMMERAGKELADIVHRKYFSASNQIVLGLVGGGNNGGDTLIALTKLRKSGWQTRAYLVKPRNSDDPLMLELIKCGGEVKDAAGDRSFSYLKKWVKNADVVLDGILGTGIQLPLRKEISSVLKCVRSQTIEAKIVAVDCPSGIDCDNGDTARECLRADLTVCMAAVKTGLLKLPAFEFAGEIEVADIGLPHFLKGWEVASGELLSNEGIKKLLPKRGLDSHKGTFGTCMVAAGSVNYCGAVLLACKGAYRIGVGLVRAAIPGATYDALAGQLPEATWLLLPQQDGVISSDAAQVVTQNLMRSTALLVGPGLGQQEETRRFLHDLIAGNPNKSKKRSNFGFTQGDIPESHKLKVTLPPMVIDADALKLISKIDDWWNQLPKESVLTPHPGEMSEMTGLSVQEIQKSRVETAQKYAKIWGHVVVLKGALTIVATPKGKYAVAPAATSALATAGTGDVLAGMIAGLLAQGMDGYSAAKCAAWVHAIAGKIAAERIGCEAAVMAGDVADSIGTALKSITGIEN